MAAGNYFPVGIMKKSSFNIDKLHAALAMLASAAVSIGLIAWALDALFLS